jgi:hypothetical protein
MMKPVPVIVAEVTVTAEVPVDASVNDCVAVVFTVTLPKLRLFEINVSCGFGVAVPVPLKATAVLPVDELLVIVSCPLALPVAMGANCTCNVIDCVGFSVAGKLPPTIVKPVPVTAAEFTVTGEFPIDVSVNVCAVVVFTVTLPKLRLVELTDNCGFAAAAPVPLKATPAVLPVDELLLIVSCPLALPVAVGANCTCKVTDWVGLSVPANYPRR